MFRFMQPIPLQISCPAVVHRHRCGLGGLATAAMRAEIAVAAMAPRAENSVANPSNSVNSFFFNISTNSTATCSIEYLI